MTISDDDHELLQAARGGDKHALIVLLDRHRGGLELYCCLMLGDRRSARAAVAETALAAWDGRDAEDAAISPRMWLYRLAIRACAAADPGCAISFGSDDRLTE
jgi:RNA polymerase sigma-70 factor (ECF subfamily)